MLKFAIYPSNHGFGHATRMAALAEELNKYGIYTFIRTNRPRHLFGGLINGLSEVSEANLDFGVRHDEGLTVNLVRTKTDLIDLLSNRNTILDTEIDFLRANQIDLIICDVPFLACEAAAYAGIPVFAISNFDWFYIYVTLYRTDRSMRTILNKIYGLYNIVDRSYRLPFSSNMSICGFPNAAKLGLLARKKDRYLDIRDKCGIDKKTPLILVSSGGEEGLRMKIEELCKVYNGLIVSPDSSIVASNHIYISKEDDFIDYVKAADILVTKPGYSSFAEAAQFGKPIIYQSRPDYPEDGVLVMGLDKYPVKYELISGTKAEWKRLIKQAIKPRDQRIPSMYRNRNAEIAAKIIEDYIIVKKYGKLRSVYDIGSNNLNYCLFDADRGIPIHQTQLSTGLGRHYDGRNVQKAGLDRTKRAIKQIQAIDKSITSDKDYLATAIARKAENINIITEWIKTRSGEELRILSGKDESKMAYWAARPYLGGGKNLIIDIGGRSIELIYVVSKKIARSQSIDIGLLDLYEDSCGFDAFVKRLQSFVAYIGDNVIDRVISVGLTTALLYQVINKSVKPLYRKELVQISKNDLLYLRKNVEEGKSDSGKAISTNVSDTAIMGISSQALVILLDIINADKIMVCTDGISAGFGRWKHSKRKD